MNDVRAITPQLACVEATGRGGRARIRRFQPETTLPSGPTQANPGNNAVIEAPVFRARGLTKVQAKLLQSLEEKSFNGSIVFPTFGSMCGSSRQPIVTSNRRSRRASSGKTLSTAPRDADRVHGRGTLDLLLFGSTTHPVLRASTCPVLIVRQR